LWGQAKGKKASSTVTFNFAHKMAKVLLTVKPGNGVTFDEVKSTALSLAGFKHNGTFNIATGAATATGTASNDAWKFTEGVHKAPVEVKEAEKELKYTLIFFPQDFASELAFTADIPGNTTLKAGIGFTVANSEADGAAAKNNLVAGRQYNLTVTLHKTAASLDQCNIQPWVVVNDNIDVD
ncbi:MAG: fimbrillin family protein, partial [Muribaculaceae bacterium]|nr:fimbrillin family protein [Muribaculaceae bacterium]